MNSNKQVLCQKSFYIFIPAVLIHFHATANSYYVATVGERDNWGVVEQYVQNQGEPKTALKQHQLFV